MILDSFLIEIKTKKVFKDQGLQEKTKTKMKSTYKTWSEKPKYNRSSVKENHFAGKEFAQELCT